MRSTGISLGLLLLLATTGMSAAEDKFHVTASEKMACTSDAVRLCLGAYPDEDKLLTCMKLNRNALSDTCRVAFDAGIKRRRL